MNKSIKTLQAGTRTIWKTGCSTKIKKLSGTNYKTTKPQIQTPLWLWLVTQPKADVRMRKQRSGLVRSCGHSSNRCAQGRAFKWKTFQKETQKSVKTTCVVRSAIKLTDKAEWQKQQHQWSSTIGERGPFGSCGFDAL